MFPSLPDIVTLPPPDSFTTPNSPYHNQWRNQSQHNHGCTRMMEEIDSPVAQYASTANSCVSNLGSTALPPPPQPQPQPQPQQQQPPQLQQQHQLHQDVPMDIGRSSSSAVSSGVPDVDIIVRSFIRELCDDDEIVVRYASCVAIEWSNMPEGCQAIASSPEFIRTLLNLLSKPFDDAELGTTIIHCAAGVLQNISQTVLGQNAILNANGVPVLIGTLNSSVESAVNFAIVSLHNLLMQHDSVKAQVKSHHGLQPIVNLLKRDYDRRFTTVVADCLRHLACKDEESQQIINSCGGAVLLLHALETSLKFISLNPDDSHPITTLSLALRSLSSCRTEKEKIVHQTRAMNIISSFLEVNNLEVQKVCIVTLRSLSDAAAVEPGMIDVLARMINLIKSCGMNYDENYEILVECALGILYNLTCVNEENKQFIVNVHGLDKLLDIIKVWNINSVSVSELAICTLRCLTSKQPARLEYLLDKGFTTLAGLLDQLEGSLEHLISHQQRQTCDLLKGLVSLLKNMSRSMNKMNANYSYLIGQLLGLEKRLSSVYRPNFMQNFNDFYRDIEEIKLTINSGQHP